MIVLGAVVLFVPYSLTLYLQTEQHPLTQNFRKNEYRIEVNDPAILEKIEKTKSLASEVSGLEDEYALIYTRRRDMRRLLSDASEMFANVSVAGEHGGGNIRGAFSNIKNPVEYFKKVFNNIIHLKSVLGGFTAGLFFVLFILQIFSRRENSKNIQSYLLPGFVIFYVLVLSLITDRIARYSWIIFPFCLMYISIEAFKHFSRFREFTKGRLPDYVLWIILFVPILLTIPEYFTGLDLQPKFYGMDSEYGNDFNEIVKGEPVFSLSAYEAYLIGSPYRILPNDSLEKAAVYGKKTGVRWLLVFHIQSLEKEARLYGNMNWYSVRDLEKYFPDLVKRRFVSDDGAMILYEIL